MGLPLPIYVSLCVAQNLHNFIHLVGVYLLFLERVVLHDEKVPRWLGDGRPWPYLRRGANRYNYVECHWAVCKCATCLAHVSFYGLALSRCKQVFGCWFSGSSGLFRYPGNLSDKWRLLPWSALDDSAGFLDDLIIGWTWAADDSALAMRVS